MVIPTPGQTAAKWTEKWKAEGCGVTGGEGVPRTGNVKINTFSTFQTIHDEPFVLHCIFSLDDFLMSVLLSPFY